MEEASRHGMGEVLRPLAENDSAAPPSYEAALNASKNAPYPTSNPLGMPCPPAAIGNTDFLPYPPAESRRMPLPSQRIGILPPLERISPPSSRIERDSPPSNRNARHAYTSSFSPRVIPPPARDAPIPLNINSSTTQPVHFEDNSNKNIFCIGGITIVIVGIIFFIFKLISTG